MPLAVHKHHLSVGWQSLLKEPLCGLIKKPCFCSLPANRAYWRKDGYQETVLDSVLVCIETFLLLLLLLFFNVFLGFMWKFLLNVGVSFVD